MKGRDMRQRDTEGKLRECRTRLDRHRDDPKGRTSSMSRPPTSISSVYFDSLRPDTRQSIKTSSTGVSMSACEYQATLERMDRLESNLAEEKRARLAAERELRTLKGDY